MTNVHMKTCNKCHQCKDISFFGKSNQMKDGFKASCNSCLNEYSKKRKQDPDIAKTINDQRKAMYEKKMQDPEKVKALREYVNNRRKDPEIRKKHNDSMRLINAKKYHTPEEKALRKARYEKIKNNPELMAKRAEKARLEGADPVIREKRRAASRKYYATKIKTNQDRVEQLNAQNRKRYAENEAHRENVLRLSEKWRKENPHLKHAQNKQRKMTIENRIPSWANIEAINDFYKNRPDGYHVDHIVPISGKNVSGLHVETNLQYLPALENLKKSNRFDA